MRRWLLWCGVLWVGCGDDEASARADTSTGEASTGADTTGADTTGTPSSASSSTATDGGATDRGGTTTAATSTGATTDSGTTEPGTTDSGTTGSGMTDSGTTDSGTTDSGTTDNGTTDNGTTDSGTTGSGTTDGETTGSGTTDTDTDTSASSTDTGIGPPLCVDIDLGGAVVPTMASTTNLADDYDPTCAPGTSDAAHQFVAPADGYYSFNTAGSSFDTVLAAYAGTDCDAPEIACDDDVVLGDPTSRVATYLTMGQPLLVVVDGFSAGEEGDYTLNVDALMGPCADVDLPSAAPQGVNGTTSMSPDRLTSSCAPVPGRDRVFVWEAPAEASYQIDTLGSTFDTVLHVYEGQCSLDELACDDDSEGTPQSLVELDLAAGQTITIVVDGFGDDEHGVFSLAIAEQ